MANDQTSDFYMDQNLDVLCDEVDEETCDTIKKMYCLKGINAADTIMIGLLIAMLPDPA